MKAVIFCFAFISSAWADIAGECNMAGFYLELGCAPVPPADNSTICPEAFTCPDLHPDPAKCYYRGVAYSDRSIVPQAAISNPCSQACGCNVADSRFDCAAVDCFEVVDRDVTTQCIKTYELDSCCTVGTVCGKDAIAKLATCEVEGTIYREGETFQPANTRKSCICTPQWNNSYEDPASCRDINCGIEIHYQAQIQNKCAPIFMTDARSCPITFQCATNSTKVIRGLNLRAVSTQCVFGNTTLTVGDELTTDEDCTKCACDVPPFVTCTKAKSC